MALTTTASGLQYEDTVIGEGSKLDCQIHIGHGAVIGKNCLFAAQVGIGGKTIVEDNVVLYGQVGIAQALHIGKGAVILAKSGVSKSLEGGKTYFGIPADEVRDKYKELAAFSQFGSDLSQDTLERLNHGERIVEVLKQPQYRPMPVEDQILILYALNNKHLDDIDVGRVLKFERDFLKYVDTHAPEIKAQIRETGELSEDIAEALDQLIAEVKKEYNYTREVPA